MLRTAVAAPNPNAVNAVGSGGLLSGAKLWVGTVVTTTNGVWTVDYSSAGFTAPPVVSPHPISTNNTPSNAIVASLTAPTKTGATGGTYIANPVTLLGIIPLQTAGAGLSVMVTAVGI